MPRDAGATERERFDVLVRTHGPRIARLVQRLLGWPSEVEDVVQDVFTAAWQQRDRFRGEANVGTWLARIAINACRTRQRRRYRWLDWWKSTGVQAGEVAETPGLIADRAVVRRAICELPTAQREVVVLRYLEGLSTVEIGEMLGVAANTIDARLSRARKELRARLGSEFETAT